MTATNDNDMEFYEEDEPVEKIQEAYTRREKGITKRPRDLNRLAASVVGDAVATSGSGGVEFDHLRLVQPIEVSEIKVG